MADSKENYKFDQGVIGLRTIIFDTLDFTSDSW